MEESSGALTAAETRDVLILIRGLPRFHFEKIFATDFLQIFFPEKKINVCKSCLILLKASHNKQCVQNFVVSYDQFNTFQCYQSSCRDEALVAAIKRMDDNSLSSDAVEKLFALLTKKKYSHI